MKKPLEFRDQELSDGLVVAVRADYETQNDSDLIFESGELLLSFAKQRDYESADDYVDKLHGVINLCREKIYEDLDGE